jgi:AMP-binding enzyme C-terminal domain
MLTCCVAGEYIAAEKLETVYSESDAVEQIWVYGSSYESVLVAVVVPERHAIKAWAQQEGLTESYEELCRNPKVRVGGCRCVFRVCRCMFRELCRNPKVCSCVCAHACVRVCARAHFVGVRSCELTFLGALAGACMNFLPCMVVHACVELWVRWAVYSKGPAADRLDSWGRCEAQQAEAAGALLRIVGPHLAGEGGSGSVMSALQYL